jgi:hypothetical protein
MSETPEPTSASMPPVNPPSLPPENVPRGTLMALLIIPAGIIAWVILWQFGLIASIVALGIAFGALWLYRFGSGGRISRTGAVRITVITVVALLLAFVGGLVAEVLPMYANQRNIDFVTALTSGEFWSFFGNAVENNFGDIMVQFVIALIFGALGCFSVLRTAFVQTRAAEAGPDNQTPAAS